MNIIFFDGEEWGDLRPFTLTKPLSELRMGAFTFRERWEKLLEGTYSHLTQDYLVSKYPICIESQNLFLNPSIFPDLYLVEAIQNLKVGDSLWSKGGSLVAAYCDAEDFNKNQFQQKVELEKEYIQIKKLWDLFQYNFHAILFDFQLLTKGRVSQPISETNGIINPSQIFIEEGAAVEYAVLNAKNGPIYIGKEVEIMEGSLVRGSFVMCEHSRLHMGSKIYPGTTIGPHCKVGGEVNNSILMGYSNKGHEGFLGNSVIGEWCNLGADTNNSNLKNNYSEIKLWDYTSEAYINSGLQFCGLMMGDYSKSAINTQFNTGTVVGVSANVFDAGFSPKFIPSFAWGGSAESKQFELDKSFEAASKMMERRKKILTEEEKQILRHIYQK